VVVATIGSARTMAPIGLITEGTHFKVTRVEESLDRVAFIYSCTNCRFLVKTYSAVSGYVELDEHYHQEHLELIT